MEQSASKLAAVFNQRADNNGMLPIYSLPAVLNQLQVLATGPDLHAALNHLALDTTQLTIQDV